jgi:putative transposase
MSRPLRIEFPGAVYHVTARGNRREPIFADDTDRHALLAILAYSLDRHDASTLAYCLMGNHYHLVLRTHRANLSGLMRYLNGVYGQRYNRRHGHVGHVLQGRFHAVLVDHDTYLAAVCRYVEQNPVRANLAATAVDWRWSSYRAHIGVADPPSWLDVDHLHGFLLGRPPASAVDHVLARRRYANLVAESPADCLWTAALRQQIFLGDSSFVARTVEQATRARTANHEIPRQQRVIQQPLTQWLERSGSRGEGLLRAHREGGMSMTAIARQLGLSVSRVSRLIAREEAKGKT